MKQPDRLGLVNTRLNALREKLYEAEIDVIVVTTWPNAYYLTLFECSNPLLVITLDRSLFLTDSRYTEAAAQSLPSPWELLALRAPAANDELTRILRAFDGKRIGFEENAPYSHYMRLKKCAPAASEIVEAGKFLADLRAVKDGHELERIAASQAINESILLSVLEELASSGNTAISELDLRRLIRTKMAERGVEESFPTIVAFGATSSRPHAQPGSTLLQNSSVMLVDMGVKYDQYCSDMTRTYAGPASENTEKLTEIYEIVLEAQSAALDAVMNGIPAKDVDQRARDVITRAGYGDCFGHGLGHGVGLEIHEAPTLNPNSEDILRSGMVITIEPGIYLPGVGGVRIEDLVVVTDKGHTNLTRYPKMWHAVFEG